MAWYVLETRYVPEKYVEVRPRHREYLATLAEQGVVAIAGPLEDNVGGLVILQAENRDELQKIIDADPYHQEGALAERTVREYTPVLGAWLPGSE
ncbi:YciI family protein [Prauserella oleivorans]|uniref:YciI family protein n=1 Tax=Prauserella oleivorans TaxID=1478153 RepID=A0ABW5WFC2_9PSEU